MTDELVVAWDYFQAVAASREAQRVQRDSENARRTAVRDAAEAERQYRKALTTAIKRLIDGGTAATAARDLARGQDHIADLGYDRDVAAGDLAILEQASWRHTANRHDVNEFVKWSQRVAPYGEQREPVG